MAAADGIIFVWSECLHGRTAGAGNNSTLTPQPPKGPHPGDRFVRQLSTCLLGRTANAHAEQLGVGMVGLGLLVMLGGTWHYIHVARSIDAETFHPARIGIVLTTLAVLLLGGVSLGWLPW